MFEGAVEKGANGLYGCVCWLVEGCLPVWICGPSRIGSVRWGSIAAERSVNSVGHYGGWVGAEAHYPGTSRGCYEMWGLK